ncbi:hypothetical protein [Halobacillus seohaensis]|uniref:Uncharacterized protein n=1 Tax=Halobacillus seohaensis TaxID=447421 RepID=A0ABW2EKV7_9BACI
MKKFFDSWHMYEAIIIRTMNEMGISGKRDVFLQEGMNVIRNHRAIHSETETSYYQLYIVLTDHFRSLINGSNESME